MIKQDEYWNEVANKKEFTTPFQPELFLTHVDRDAVILDYGCGYGRTLSELRGYGYKNLHGVDFSEEMIKRAKSNDSEIDFQVIQSGKLPFPNHSLDAVLLFAVLTCVHKDEEQNAILNEIKRVLKPGASYILMIFCSIMIRETKTVTKKVWLNIIPMECLN